MGGPGAWGPMGGPGGPRGMGLKDPWVPRGPGVQGHRPQGPGAQGGPMGGGPWGGPFGGPHGGARDMGPHGGPRGMGLKDPWASRTRSPLGDPGGALLIYFSPKISIV